MSLDLTMSEILQTLSVTELEGVRAVVDRQICEKRESDIELAVAEVEEIISRYGVSMQDVISRIDARPDRPVKWRHPERPELTWCGRGRRPLWMNEAVDAGISLAKMRA